MGIDIHRLKNGRPEDLLLTINESEYQDLLPAIEIYSANTGLLIDQHSDLKLSSTVIPLIEALEASANGSEIYRSLIGILKQSDVEGYGIIFIGD